jgi:hypothetical protein
MPRRVGNIIYDDAGNPVGGADKWNKPTAPLPGSGSLPKIPETPSYTLADIAKRLFESTDPLRSSLIGQSADFLSGGMDPTLTPEYSAIRNFANQQSSQAKDNILSTMPSGGTLLDKLADVDISKARTLTDASAGIYGDNMNRAMSLAIGSPLQTSISGTGAAAQMQAAKEQAEATESAGQKSGMGEAVGAVAAK